MRRRGYTPEAIRNFCERIGVAKFDGIIDMSWLEDAVREDLNKRAPRVHGRAAAAEGGDRQLPRGPGRGAGGGQQPGGPGRRHAQGAVLRVLYIEQDDFREDPPKDFFRLAPGREVRLRYAYFIKCDERGEGREDRRGRSSCTAPTTRRRAAATPRTAAR